MPTLAELTKTVKELSFDRFLVPSLFVKLGTGKSIKVTTEGIAINADSVGLNFQDHPLFADALDFIADALPVASSPYFVDTDFAENLRPFDKIEGADGKIVQLNRRNFFSDRYIAQIVQRYFTERIQFDVAFDDVEEAVTHIPIDRIAHAALWCAYHLVEQRRLFQLAADALGQSNFTDGSGVFNDGAVTSATTQVQVGSVFSLSDDPTSGFIDRDFTKINAANTLGDLFSFWFRIQMDIRKRFESRYKDFSLRGEDGMWGTVELERPLNYLTYYDSWPYTLSPLSRGILSKV